MGYTVGLYVPRLAVVSWNPLALVGRTWQFCGKPPRNQARHSMVKTVEQEHIGSFRFNASRGSLGCDQVKR